MTFVYISLAVWAFLLAAGLFLAEKYRDRIKRVEKFLDDIESGKLISFNPCCLKGWDEIEEEEETETEKEETENE